MAGLRRTRVSFCLGSYWPGNFSCQLLEIGVDSLRGAPLTIPTLATAPCILPIGGGRVVHLVALYDYLDAGNDTEQLVLTSLLLDAALCELAVVGRFQPAVIVGDFNVGPPKFLLFSMESRLGSGLT